MEQHGLTCQKQNIEALNLWKLRLNLHLIFYETGFLNLSCGGARSYVDSSKITWVSDDAFISTGNTTFIEYVEDTSSSSVPL